MELFSFGGGSDGDGSGAGEGGGLTDTESGDATTGTPAPDGTGGDGRTTVARASAAVEYDGSLAEAEGAPGAGARAVTPDELATALPDGVPEGVVAEHARALSTVGREPADEQRARTVEATARKQANVGVSPSAYVASYMPAFEALVDAAFDAVEDGADPAAAREGLLDGLRAGLVDAQLGVDAHVHAATGGRERDDGTSGADVSREELFDAIPYPAFLIADDHTVLEYNVGLRRLLSLGDDHRAFLGVDNREAIAAATYTDGSRHRSLVDKVAENPRDAEDHWDVDRVDEEYEYVDGVIYEDTSVTKDTEGNETHIGFLAVPIFDDDGDLKAVFEFVEDRSEEVLHQKAVSALIGEVTETLESIGDGDLAARAEFEDDHGVIEPELLGLTDDVNEMADSFQELVERVDETTAELTASIETATDLVDQISEQVVAQNRSTGEVTAQVEDFSAAMEEVATTANEVSDAADATLEEVGRGTRAGEDARAVTEELLESSDGLVETVEGLDGYMDEIGDVVDVIADVAEQTNILALNANIEAARAEAGGEGFAVVAEEVKSLATQAQEHTDEVADRIELIQSHTADTVAEVEASYGHIQTVGEEIEATVEALETISQRVETATDGIQEVAEANDEQAEGVHEVMAELDSLQESSDRVAETTDDIVAEANDQERIVRELADRVQELSTGDDAAGRPDIE